MRGVQLRTQEELQLAMTEDRLIRVDMSQQSVVVEPFPEKWEVLGGRALTARILLANS